MARRMFEFVCDNGHIHECLIDSEVREKECPVCGNVATRIMSAVRCELEGITGDFPGAYAKWNRVHQEAARVANKKRDRNGPPSGL